MALEHLRSSTLPRALSAAVSDLADLLQKEIRLARAELSSKLSAKMLGGVWMAAAGILGLISVLLVVQALVFAIASYGIALYWAFLIVAAGIALVGALAFAKGRSDAKVELTPTRTVEQVKQDIATAREKLG